MRKPLLLGLACLFMTATAASAITVSFSGNFTQDDNVVLFQYSIANDGLVAIMTTSYAGGGFSPILTLFDSTGAFITENVGASNPIASDAAIPPWNAFAGEWYIIALTEYDNTAIGNTGGNLSEGFLHDGEGNFTAASPFNPDTPGGSFLMPGLEQKTSFWSIEFTSADPTLLVVPEPSTALLSLGGVIAVAGGLAARRRRRR